MVRLWCPIRRDRTPYNDFFGGLRGGSGNFDIVTKFAFRVHHIPPHMLAGYVVYLTPTVCSASRVAANFDKNFQNLPPSITPMMVLPGGAPVVVNGIACFGDQTEVREVAALLKSTQLGGGWFKLENSVRSTSYHYRVAEYHNQDHHHRPH
jgi:hypothetical protein